MISETTFYGGAEEVNPLTGNYTVSHLIARVWRFNPTSSGYDITLPNTEGLKRGGIYFIILNMSDTYTFTVKDHNGDTLTLVDTEEACVISLSESTYTYAIGASLITGTPYETPSHDSSLIGKWGIGIPTVYGSGVPSSTEVLHWNWKIMTIGYPEDVKAIRYYLFGGAGDLNGCDQFEYSGEVWAAKTDIPYDHSGSWCFHPLIHYIMVGIGSSNEYIYKFTPTQNTWVSEGGTPDAHQTGAAFALNGKGYVVCGSTSKYMESYFARTWARKRKHDYYTQGCSAAADGSKGYLTNGYNTILSSEDNLHFEYNPITDTWSEKDELPTPLRFNHGAFLIQDSGVYYVVGGYTTIGPAIQSDTDGWVPSTDTWSAKDPLPAARHSGATSAAHFPGDGTGQLGHYFTGSSGAVSHDDSYIYRANSPPDDWIATTDAPAIKFGASAGYAGV